MANAVKVHEYDEAAVRESIVRAFRERRGEAAPADIVAFTGLPKIQVDTELPAVADEFGGRLKVTESGEILYSFPDGLHSRFRGFGPAFRRFRKAAGKVAVAVGTFFFKAWIMVMLIGYFALFVALAVMAVLASVAISASDRNGKSRGRGGVNLVGGLFDLFIRIWFYNEVFKTPGQRRYQVDSRNRDRGNRRPLHKAIFSFVFGEPDPNADHDSVEKRAFVALARQKKGVILLEDFMAVTGLPRDEADRAINRYLYEFEGSPEVSDSGTVWFSFPKLLLRSRADDGGAADSPFRRIRPFSANDKKSNAWYAAINGINLVFGSYFLYCTLAYEALSRQAITGGTYLFWFVGNLASGISSNPLALVMIGLGIVPLAFSALFWLVPVLRAGVVARQNDRIRLENMRRTIYAAAVDSPSAVRAPDPATLSAAARPKDGAAPRKVVEELAASLEGEVLPGGSWRLVELERKAADIERVRAAVRPEASSLGSIAFDSGS
ncbi:MAG: hypothetical protein CVV51_02270 [Spirochaetae bacterium HGW-Spirochaetae-7]|nr:MAG: hypothetical protein CVV51_02270 [Spirochaetae bacterium HGW-Spirochaetae-7]